MKYSTEKNVQILISVLKANNIKKVIVSPGATNLNFVSSLQNDGSFELYSAVDERGAAYMACGMAYESNEPVVITCTGATASRNYLPGLTEAYHRKLPILAVTATQDTSNCGNLIPQFIDRSISPSDSVKYTIELPFITDDISEKKANLDVNKAILELYRNGGGPVHINLTTRYINDFTDSPLPKQRIIERFNYEQILPNLPKRKIAITVGGHKVWSDELTRSVDEFCEKNNAIVLTDHSSGYHGKYNVHATLLATQEAYLSQIFDIDLLLHIGEESGDYYVLGQLHHVKEVWRISEDGEVRDTFGKLSKVFQMKEKDFFDYYAKNSKSNEENHSYYEKSIKEIEEIKSKIPNLPFSNIYVASKIAPNLTENSMIHLGVSNTMRAWTFFDFPKSVGSIANVGCRGIDGALSTVLGMSLVNKEKIHYCVLGDLTFFYNINALGNRQVGRNLRIILVNNGIGGEFKIYQHRAQQLLQDKANDFVAAGGHNGQKSPDLIRHFSQDLGFEYLTANDKESFEKAVERFLTPELTEKPMIFEIFTEPKNESDALKIIRTLDESASGIAKKVAKQMLGEKGVAKVKKMLGK